MLLCTYGIVFMKIMAHKKMYSSMFFWIKSKAVLIELVNINLK